ncbi:MAG: hypothetical protein VB013_10495 [Anaerolineaceae bacterium]|nr:hypothetical protein [Anaerolineaceae bacterium]
MKKAFPYAEMSSDCNFKCIRKYCQRKTSISEEEGLSWRDLAGYNVFGNLEDWTIVYENEVELVFWIVITDIAFACQPAHRLASARPEIIFSGGQF